MFIKKFAMLLFVMAMMLAFAGGCPGQADQGEEEQQQNQQEESGDEEDE
ncbi:MAG TPA: hypothetical protein VLH18_02975 [Candidatus Limnocylindrales bacterium]|nr:hypothetical protein [Candidatus Limnocylindrales bacterium]